MERERALVHLFYSFQSVGINVAYIDCPLGSRFPYISSNRELLTVTRRVSLMEQELLTFPEHPSSPPVLSEVRVPQSLLFCIVFCRSLFFLLSFFIGSLYCLPFFELRSLGTPLISSNLSVSGTRR